MAAKRNRRQRPIRVGVIGVGRGQTFAHQAEHAGMELVALCDLWEERLQEVGKRYGVTTYTDYAAFLEHDMDAVVLANYFHEHAPFAIAALQAGKHVLCECSACFSLAEGVALARAVEASKCIFMLAENYPYMVFNQEMQRLYKKGTVGKFLYGEGEYVHPDSAQARLKRSVGVDHWRHWIPSTYYCTHGLAPVMYITDTRPVQVNGFVVPYDADDGENVNSLRRSDTAGAILLRMDNGALVKLLNGGLRGHQNFVRIHGNKGLMENCRHGNRSAVRLRREYMERRKGEPQETIYEPEFPVHAAAAKRSGHGGGDFFTNYYFAEAIRTGKSPYLDVYRAIDMSITGILAWRSALEGGVPIAVPDFRNEKERRQYEQDDWAPKPAKRRGKQQAPSSVLGKIEPPPEAFALARRVWKTTGYTEPV